MVITDNYNQFEIRYHNISNQNELFKNDVNKKIVFGDEVLLKNMKEELNKVLEYNDDMCNLINKLTRTLKRDKTIVMKKKEEKRLKLYLIKTMLAKNKLASLTEGGYAKYSDINDYMIRCITNKGSCIEDNFNLYLWMKKEFGYFVELITFKNELNVTHCVVYCKGFIYDVSSGRDMKMDSLIYSSCCMGLSGCRNFISYNKSYDNSNIEDYKDTFRHTKKGKNAIGFLTDIFN